MILYFFQLVEFNLLAFLAASAANGSHSFFCWRLEGTRFPSFRLLPALCPWSRLCLRNRSPREQHHETQTKSKSSPRGTGAGEHIHLGSCDNSREYSLPLSISLLYVFVLYVQAHYEYSSVAYYGGNAAACPDPHRFLGECKIYFAKRPPGEMTVADFFTTPSFLQFSSRPHDTTRRRAKRANKRANKAKRVVRADGTRCGWPIQLPLLLSSLVEFAFEKGSFYFAHWGHDRKRNNSLFTHKTAQANFSGILLAIEDLAAHQFDDAISDGVRATPFRLLCCCKNRSRRIRHQQTIEQ